MKTTPFTTRFFTISSLLILINIFSINALIAAPGDSAMIPEVPSGGVTGNNSPVWNGYKTPSNNQQQASPRPNTGFASPPPTKLKAKIIPSAQSVTQGESIIFRLEDENPGAHYYWLLGDQKSTDRSFKVDTSNLAPGKHRVRVSVTNKAKDQANSQAFFEVRGSTEKEPPVDDQGNPLEDENGRPLQNNQEASETDNKIVSIEPSTLSINQGEIAHFKANIQGSSGYQLRWRFGTQLADMDQFQVSTQDVTPGSYRVYLRATANNGETSSSIATLIIKDPEAKTTKVPDLIGKPSGNVEELLKEAQLEKGSVEQKEVEENAGQVIEQSPEAGTEVNIDTKVNIIIGIGAKVDVPDVTGKAIEEAKSILKNTSLSIGSIEEKESEEEGGNVLSQDPEPSAKLKQGEPVNLVISIKKATSDTEDTDTDTDNSEEADTKETDTKVPSEKSEEADNDLDISIQPPQSVIEQGANIQFTAMVANIEEGADVEYAWSFGSQTSNTRQFEVSTRDLAVGNHNIKLKVTDNKGRTSSIESVLEVTAKSLLVPALTDMSLEDARKELKQSGLQLGTVEKQQGDVEQETITEQSPGPGQRVNSDQRVDLILVVPKPGQNNQIRVDVAFDKTSGKAGEPIVFTTKITPEGDMNNVHYVYSINDAKKANVNSSYTWTPEIEDTYTVSVTAYNDDGILAKSESYILDITAGWETPIAKLLPKKIELNQGEKAEFVSNSTYDLNSTLKYEWISSTGHSGSKKTFAFDTTEVAAGNYDITLTVTDDKSNQSTATANLILQESGTAASTNKGTTSPEVVEFTNANKGQGGNKPQILLNVSRRLVQTGQNIKFNMQVKPTASADTLYYYQLGDKKRRQWLKTSNYEHEYNGFGSYSVRAVVKQGEQTYFSKPVTIWVWSPLLLGLIGGIGSLLLGLMWWWTKRIHTKSKHTSSYGEVVEEQVSLPKRQYDKNDIITEKRPTNTVASVLIKGIIQFILGVLLSLVILFLFLKLIGLV